MTKPLPYKGIMPREYQTLIQPESLYLGWDDPTPIYCMKGNPNIMTLMPLGCKPNKAAIEEMKQQGMDIKPFPVIEAKNGNGETVTITIDENDKVISVDKKLDNFIPIAIAAAIAFAFLGG